MSLFLEQLQKFTLTLPQREQTEFAKTCWEMQANPPTIDAKDETVPKPSIDMSATPQTRMLKAFDHYLKCQQYYRVKFAHLPEKEIKILLIKLDHGSVGKALSDFEAEQIYQKEHDHQERINALVSGFNQNQQAEFYKLAMLDGVGELTAAMIVANS